MRECTPCERRLRHIFTLSLLSSGWRSLFSAAFHACDVHGRLRHAALIQLALSFFMMQYTPRA